MDATVTVPRIELGSPPVARVLSLALAEIRGQAYWFIWLAVIALDLYSARQTEYEPWLWSRYSWWIAPFVLWITMPRIMRWPNAGLPALLVFTWLAFSLYEFAQYALVDWFKLDVVAPVRSLRFIPHFMLAASIAALGLAHATVRVFGPRAVVAALVAGGVAGLSSHWWALSDWSRWVERPLAIHIHLFGLAMVTLIYAAGVDRLSRSAVGSLPPVAAAADSPPPKERIMGFPVAVASALILWGAAFAGTVNWEESHPWVGWACYSLGGIVVLALLTWAAKRALRRAAYQAHTGGRTALVLANVRRMGVWMGLLAIWVPIAMLTWKESGQELDELVTAIGGPIWTLSVSDDGKTLHFVGAVASGLTDDIESVLSKHPDISTLDLESGGGEVFEAYAIAELVKDKGLVTLVRDHCESACTMIFAAGKQRLLGEEGTLGYHDENIYGLPTDRPVEDKLAFERGFGIDVAFLERTFRVPHWDMWYPEKDELLKAGIVTKVGTTPDVDEPKEFKIGSWRVVEPDREGSFAASASGPGGGMLAIGCMPDLGRCSWYVAADIPCDRTALVPVTVSAGGSSQSLMVRCKPIDERTFLTFEDFNGFEALLAKGTPMDMVFQVAASEKAVFQFDTEGAARVLAYMHRTIAKLMPKVALDTSAP